MAYKFGQFRKQAYSNYVTPITSYTLTTVSTEATGFEGITFKDVAIDRGFTTKDGSLFLRFSVTRFTRETGVTIKLVKENATQLTNNTQIIETIVVPAPQTGEDASTPIVYDIVITPNEGYGKLVFQIDRDGDDFTGTPRAWIPAQEFKVISFGTITNIVSAYLNDKIENTGRLKQIGVQSRPGFEMCIDGELVRIGRSGIYEINHGIDILFVGFMPESGDQFFMDYQY